MHRNITKYTFIWSKKLDSQRTGREYLDNQKDEIQKNSNFFYFDILFKKKQPIKEIRLCHKLIVVFLCSQNVAREHLKLLKKIRDENYGHLYKFGIERKKFKDLYQRIKGCIIELSSIYKLQSRESKVNELENRRFRLLFRLF